MNHLVSCLDAAHSCDTRYCYGECTWHGPIAQTHMLTRDGETLPYCPLCSGLLYELPSEFDWWAMVANQERNSPGYEAMLRWSQGRCFPDAETMQNSYRQAMEGSW